MIDLHTHTKYSDGTWELEELLKKVINMKRAMTMLDNVCH